MILMVVLLIIIIATATRRTGMLGGSWRRHVTKHNYED